MNTTISKGSFSVTADTFGGQLVSIKKGNDEYLWQADPKWWKGSAPILFPIVASLRDSRAMTKNGPCSMPRHGLIRKTEYLLAESSEDAVTYEISDTDEMYRNFPYHFTVRMHYSIPEENTVSTEFRITNRDTIPMPFMFGGHPAFNVPAGGAKDDAFENYVLKFTKKISADTYLMDAKGLYTLTDEYKMHLMTDSDTLPLTHDLLSHDVLTMQDIPDDTVSCVSTKTGRGVCLHFPGFPYLGIWSAANEAPFVAVEPWAGCSTRSDEDDIFEHKKCARTIEPGETFRQAFTITVL